MKGFDLFGKIFGKGTIKMNETDRKLGLMPTTALYFILRDGDKEGIKLRPDLFPNKITNNGNYITMEAVMQINTVYGHKNRYIFPFTDGDVLIEDYKNGVVDIYPTNRVLIVEGTSDYTTYTIVGAYDMTSGIYENVTLTENWDVVDNKLLNSVRFPKGSTVADLVGETIIRQSPAPMELTPRMREFFAWLKNNKVDLDK